MNPKPVIDTVKKIPWGVVIKKQRKWPKHLVKLESL